MPKSYSRSRKKRSRSRKKYRKNAIRIFCLSVIGLTAAALLIPSKSVEDESLIKDSTEVQRGKTDYEYVLASGTEQAVHNFLKRLSSSDENLPLPNQVGQQFKRIAVADRLLEIGESKPMKQFAIESKIEASALVVSLDFKNKMNLKCVSEFQNVAEPFLEAEDEKVRRLAKVTSAQLRVIELLRSPNEQAYAMVNQAVFNVLNSYPDDMLAIGNIHTAVARVLEHHPEFGARLIKDIFSNYSQGNSLEIEQLAFDLNDQLLLAELEFDRAVENRWVNGPAQIVSLCKKLAQNASLGVTGIGRIGNALAWFEQIHDFDSMSQLNLVLAESDKRLVSTPAKEFARKLAESGSQRAKTLGTKLQVNFPERPEKKGSKFAGKMIRVLAFINESQRSARVIKLLLEVEKDWKNQGVEFLAIDEDGIASLKERMQELKSDGKSTRFLNPSDWSSRELLVSLLAQYPVVDRPHILLLDHRGRAFRLNVQIVDLETYLVDCRNKRRNE